MLIQILPGSHSALHGHVYLVSHRLFQLLAIQELVILKELFMISQVHTMFLRTILLLEKHISMLYWQNLKVFQPINSMKPFVKLTLYIVNECITYSATIVTVMWLECLIIWNTRDVVITLCWMFGGCAWSIANMYRSLIFFILILFTFLWLLFLQVDILSN